MELFNRYWEVLIAGLIQGTLEWLPVSSSGQIILFYTIIMGLDPIASYKYSLMLHLGTGLSAVIILRYHLFEAIRYRNHWLKLLLIPFIAGLPIGLAIYTGLNTYIPVSEPLIGILLIVTGIVLILMERRGYRGIEDLKAIEYILLGVAQGFTVLPGLSRSAITVGLLGLMGVKPGESIRASILMGIPATISAGLYVSIFISPGPNLDGLAVSIAILSSFASGMVMAKSLIYLSDRLGRNIGALLIILGLIVLSLYSPLHLTGIPE